MYAIHRSDNCDVRIHLCEVSAEHCKLVLTEKGQVSVFSTCKFVHVYYCI